MRRIRAERTSAGGEKQRCNGQPGEGDQIVHGDTYYAECPALCPPDQLPGSPWNKAPLHSGGDASSRIATLNGPHCKENWLFPLSGG